MRCKALLLLLPLLTSCASPAYVDSVLEPPGRYNYPYEGPVVEYVMTLVNVRQLCASRGAFGLIAACSFVDDGTCYMVLPSDGQTSVATYRRHETAHCNGWPADHPRDE